MRLEQRSGQWETEQSATNRRPWLARKDHPKNEDEPDCDASHHEGKTSVTASQSEGCE